MNAWRRQRADASAGWRIVMGMVCLVFTAWPVLTSAAEDTEASDAAAIQAVTAPAVGVAEPEPESEPGTESRTESGAASETPSATVNATASDSTSTPVPAAESELPDVEQLQARGARIGAIEIDVTNVFDPANPKENRIIYRLANGLHIKTQPGTIRPQLLFKSGDVYSAHALEETARNLRARRYLADARIVPVRYHPDSNTVDVAVKVRDVWTLSPGVSYGRSGGESRSGFQLEEHNLFGWGKAIQAERRNDVDRSVWDFTYVDPNVLRTRWEMSMRYRDASDGGAKILTLKHPFFSLDTRYSGALSLANEQRMDRRFEQGVAVDQYVVDLRQRNVEAGWSTGLHGTGTQWVLRTTLGYQVDDRNYMPDLVNGTLQLPENTRLHYPWLGVAWFQDSYVVTRNRERIERTEDMYLGRAVSVRFGYASPQFGSDRVAKLLNLVLQDAWTLGDRQNVFAKWSVDGRHEEQHWRNTLYSTSLRYDWRQNRHYLLAVKFDHAFLKNPDDVTQLYLGSDEGMRGYPLRYRSGTERSVLTVEQRYYSRGQILRLLSVGAAAYVDVGRITGVTALANDTQRNFVDVGIGARLGNIRSSGGEMFHLDLAYPVNAPKADRKLQFSVITRKTF